MSDVGRVWRTPLWARAFLTLFALFCVAGVLMPWDDGFVTLPPDGSGSYDGDLGYRLLGVGLAAVTLALAYRGRMEIREGRLIVRYLLTTREIPLDTVLSVTPTDTGLDIETDGGRRYGSPAFIGEKSPLAGWLRRRTRSDDIAEAIMASRP